jgi:GNAT superfamily N-acetyltransferase
MDPLDLIDLQIRLEYAKVQNGLLVPFPGSSEQGLYIVYRHAGGYVQYLNHKLPEELRTRLVDLGSSQAYEAPARVEQILSTYIPAHFEGLFASEYLPTIPEPAEFRQVVNQEGQYIVLVENTPVCCAWSERSNDQCAEVAVETLPEHRRQGYARQAVAAWAQAVLQSGRTAFYSYKAENDPSRALARSLGSVWYADVVAYA